MREYIYIYIYIYIYMCVCGLRGFFSTAGPYIGVAQCCFYFRRDALNFFFFLFFEAYRAEVDFFTV